MAVLLQATGDSDYLSDANDFYILHLYSEQSGPATLAADWSEYFWSANILLATLTDSPNYHQYSQYFLRQWICSYGQVSWHSWWNGRPRKHFCSTRMEGLLSSQEGAFSAMT